MMMVPMLVRTQPYHPTLDTYSPSCSLNIPRARAGGENGLIVADTLLEKAMQFANAICRFGRDPQTKLKAGSKFINDGFLQKIVDQTYSSKMFPTYCAYTQPLLLVTSANKLQRHLNPKTYFGREEYQLMVKQAPNDSLLHGRKVTVQKITVVGLGFIIGLRPGSLGPSEKLYEEHEKVRRLFFSFFLSTQYFLSTQR